MKISRQTGKKYKGAAKRAPIAILTDFGYRDHYAGALQGVIKSIAPATDVIDITHGVPPQSRLAGALVLRESWRFFPTHTIFLAIVDPGVGTMRRPIAIATRPGARFIGPDNGLLWMAATQAGIKSIVELENKRYRLPQVSTSFHGRDIFAPAAAWLSRGVKLGSLGSSVTQIERLDLSVPILTASAIVGKVEYIDSFGNLITNIDHNLFQDFKKRFPAINLWVTIEESDPIPIRNTYADVSPNTPLALFGSFGLLELAKRNGAADAHFSSMLGARVEVKATAKQR